VAGAAVVELLNLKIMEIGVACFLQLFVWQQLLLHTIFNKLQISQQSLISFR
jgi:hypothetical protein